MCVLCVLVCCCGVCCVCCVRGWLVGGGSTLWRFGGFAGGWLLLCDWVSLCVVCVCVRVCVGVFVWCVLCLCVDVCVRVCLCVVCVFVSRVLLPRRRCRFRRQPPPLRRAAAAAPPLLSPRCLLRRPCCYRSRRRSLSWFLSCLGRPRSPATRVSPPHVEIGPAWWLPSVVVLLSTWASLPSGSICFIKRVRNMLLFVCCCTFRHDAFC